MAGRHAQQAIRCMLAGNSASKDGVVRLAKALAYVFAMCIVAFSLTGLFGCKYSDVLTQHIEDPEHGLLDESADPTYQINPDAPERPDLADVSISKSDDQNTQAKVLPHYDPEAPDNGPTPQRRKSTQTPHDEEASEGEDTDNPDRKGSNAGEGEGGDEAGTTEDDNDEGNDEGSGEDTTSDEAEDPEESDSAGAGDTTVVVDPDGTKEDTPKGTVAAVGEYATITQMLGGAGALVACDEEWLNARKTDGAFSGELSRVQTAFSGDGTQDKSCDTDKLIKNVKPSVLLWDSTANEPALTEAERVKLEDAGVKVQVVPHLGERVTEDMEITAAAQVVASVLEGVTGIGLDPAAALDEYTTFHNDVLASCYKANDGYSYKITDGQYAYLYQNTPAAGLEDVTTTRIATVFVDSLMQPGVSRATVSQNATTVDGTIRLPQDGQSVDVSDGVALSASTNTPGYMLMDYYLQLSGYMNNAYDGPKPESQGRPYIIMPGNTNAFGTSSKYASRSTASALFYNSGDATVTNNWHVLGNYDFPAMLVASDDIAEAIVKSASKSDGLYHMENPYEVIVMPSGLAGSWSEGHVDSFLLAPWAFRISSADNLESAKSYVQAFYEKFFRCKDWEKAVRNWDSAYTAQ